MMTIYQAAESGDSAVIAQILAEDPSLVNSYSPDGWTSLHLASFYGRLEAIETLFEHGANLQALSQSPLSRDNTPLHAAVANSQLEAVPKLIALGADVNFRQESGGYTPHRIASFDARCPIIQILLEEGADPAIADDNGITPAHMAVKNGQMTAADLLGQSSSG